MRALAMALSRLPMTVLYALAEVLAWMAAHVVGYRQKVIVENLSKSFPDKKKSEIKKIARQFYSHLSQVVVESLKGLTISREEIKRRVIFLNSELLFSKVEQGESVLVLTSHFCNWEWILLGFSAQTRVPIVAVYQPLSNSKADAIMYSMRSKFGAKLIADSKTMRELIASRSQPKIVAVVADQTPRPKDKQFTFNFLNQKTPFFAGPQKIAEYLNCCVYYADMQKIRAGYYEVSFTQIGGAPYQADEHGVIGRFAHCLEQSIQQQPTYWLWSHKRWKYAK